MPTTLAILLLPVSLSFTAVAERSTSATLDAADAAATAGLAATAEDAPLLPDSPPGRGLAARSAGAPPLLRDSPPSRALAARSAGAPPLLRDPPLGAHSGATADAPPPLLRVPPVGAAPQRDPAGAPEPGDEAARSGEARKAYAARRYREAAQLYEALWRDTRAAKYRFNAGMARAAADHDGAAIVHWEGYLAEAGAVSAGERSMLEREIAAARQRTTAVQLRVEGPLAPAKLTLSAPEDALQGPRDPLELVPGAAVDLSLEAGEWIATLVRPGRKDAVVRFRVGPGAERVILLGAEEPEPTPPPVAPRPVPEVVAGELTLSVGPPRALARGATVELRGPGASASQPVREATTTWKLAPGAWSVRVESPERAPGFGAVTLGPGERRGVTIQLRRDRAAQARLGVGVGLGGAGLVFVTAGAIVAARAPHTGLVCTDRATCSASADHVLDRSIGFSLIGTGLGAAGPAVTAGLARSDRALKIEAGVGAALLVGGVAWYLGEARTSALDHIAREHGAATVLGLGGGMLGGAAIALIVRRLIKSRTAPVSLTPTFTPHSRGLAVQARF